MGARLIDKIYESCFVPESWPEVLDELGRLGDAPGASLFVLNDKAQYYTTSPEPRERAQRLIDEGWLHRGRIIPRLFAERHSGFLIDVEFFSPEELEEEPDLSRCLAAAGCGLGHGNSHNVADRRKSDVRLVPANRTWPVRTRWSAKAR